MPAFSAPGKALLAGGYLVIDPQFKAYVTALSARMHAVVETVDVKESIVSVSSPQFGGFWEYQLSHGETVSFKETQSRKNPFLEATLRTVLDYVVPKDPVALKITLFSDPGYHTQQNTVGKTSADGKHTFLFHDAPIEKVAKTGMGSSAGLVSVVTCALLTQLLGKSLSELTTIIHNVAQIAHCEAQKKIGSGFDVAAAVYGSIIYQRFPPSTIDHLLGTPLNSSRTESLRAVVGSEWTMNHEKCALPNGITLIMGDVHAGSETPKLVSKVLAWKQCNKQEGEELYERINSANTEFISQLAALHNRPDTPKSVLSLALDEIRAGLRVLTEKTGADIEPCQQTELLDRCGAINGCLGGVVPGAGGFDAICLLVLSDKVEDFKCATRKDDFFKEVSWLELSEEADGLLEENAESYKF